MPVAVVATLAAMAMVATVATRESVATVATGSVATAVVAIVATAAMVVAVVRLRLLKVPLLALRRLRLPRPLRPRVVLNKTVLSHGVDRLVRWVSGCLDELSRATYGDFQLRQVPAFQAGSRLEIRLLFLHHAGFAFDAGE